MSCLSVANKHPKQTKVEEYRFAFQLRQGPSQLVCMLVCVRVCVCVCVCVSVCVSRQGGSG